jgi:hypothetical protein
VIPNVKTTPGYAYLAEMFWHDWVLAGGEVLGPGADSKVYLPVIMKH